jgi:hypothetical protein
VRTAGDRPEAVQTGEVRWRLQIRRAVRESEITQSQRFMSWCDELSGVKFTCPRCGRMKAVLRRWKPTGCRPIYWLLCPSFFDRRINIMSEEVFREWLAQSLGPDNARLALGTRPPAPGHSN